MKTTTSIIFDHRGRAPKGGKGQLEVRITNGRKSYYIGTGIKVHRSEFVAGRIINCPGAKGMNDRLEILYNKVLTCISDFESQDKTINIKQIRDKVYNESESISEDPVFINWAKKQIPLMGISSGTTRHYELLIGRLIEYGKILRWQDITVENICNFDSWLHTLQKPISDARIKAGARPERISDATIHNYHKNLKHLLIRADLFGKIERNPYEKLKGHFPRGDKDSVEFLTKDEIDRFMSLELPIGSPLDVAHDLFIFMMWTGMAYSDAQAFNIKRYKYDGSQWSYIGKRIKTGSPYVSVLLPPAVNVLEKYGMKVPKMNNADYNRQLKALGVMAGITTRMHTHLARHTFATYMLNNGVPIHNVTKMLGQKNVIQTQRYAKVLAQSVHDDFSRIAKELSEKDKGR